MSKAYVMHRGWLGVNEVEVTIEGYAEDRCIVKAVEGHPFDLWIDARNIPNGAHVRYHHDTYWYDAKIVPLSAVRVVEQ